MAYSTVVLPPGFGGSESGNPGGSSGGPVSSPLLAPFGSAAAPGYAFDGAPSMGIYAVSVGVLGLASQGRQVAQLDQAGNFLLTGGLRLQGGFVTQQAGSALINTSQSTAAGNVVAPPGSLFQSSQGGTVGLQFKLSGTDASGWVSVLGPRPPVFPIAAPTSAASSLPYSFAGQAGTGIHSQAGELALATGNTDRVVIGADGALGLRGDTTVTGNLSASGSASLASLSVTTDAVLRGGATVQNAVLTAQQGVTVSGGTLNVAGLSSFGGRVSVSGLLTATAGAALSGGLTLDTGAQIINAPGDPRGTVSAAAGSVFLSSDGGAGKTFFVKEVGTGSDGWAVGGSSVGSGVVYPLFAPQSTDGTTPQYAFDGGSAGLLSPAAKTLVLSTDDVARLTIGPDGYTSLSGGLGVLGAANFSTGVGMASTLSVAGSTALGSLSVAGPTQLAASLRVQDLATLFGGAAVGGDLGVSGTASLSGPLSATGGASFGPGQLVEIKGALSLLGTVALQSGSHVLNGPGGPQGRIAASPASTYANTTDGSLWVKQTGSDVNGWVQVPTSGLPQSTFPLQAPDGDASAPSYSFLASPSAGLFSPAAGELALSTAGATRLHILSSGDAELTGSLSVGGAAQITGQARFMGGGSFIGSGPLNVGGQAHFADQLSVDGTLSVGGAASLSAGLQVTGSTALGALTASSSTFTGIVNLASGTAAAPSLALSAAAGTGLFSDAAHSGLGVSVAGSQVGYFSSTGYTSTVGPGVIGTATSYSTTTDGTAQVPAYAVNGRGGIYYDGTGMALAAAGTQVLRGTGAALSLLLPTSVQAALGVAGSLSVTGASTFTKTLVVGAGLQGQAATTGGALIEGQLAVGGGSVSAPGYALVGAQDTGFFADTAHSGLGVSVAGSQVGYFNAGGFTSTATGPSTPLIDLVVTSAQSQNLTLSVAGSTSSVPTATLLGTYSSGASYQQAGNLTFAVKNVSGGGVTSLYTLSAGGFPASTLRLGKVGTGAPILAYDDATGTTSLGLPTTVGQLSVTSKALLPSASAAAPSLAFTAAGTTGVFYDAGHSGLGIAIGGTQVGYFNASGYNPLTGGTAMNVVAPIVTVSSGTYQLTAGQSGCFVNFTASATATLPAANAAAVGTYFTFMVGAANATASVAIDGANTSDSLYFVGGTITAGQALSSQARRYALLTVECSALGQWTVASVQGVWGGSGVTVSQTNTLIASPDSNNLTLDSSGAPDTSASLRLISPSGRASLLRFATGTPASPTDVWAISGLASGTAALKLTNLAGAYDVFSYTDASNTPATRSFAFGGVNVSGLRSLSVGDNPVSDAALPIQLNAAASSLASYAVTAGTGGTALTLGYSNAASGTPTGGYLATRVAQPMYFTAGGLTQTAIAYTATGLVSIGSASPALSALGVFGGLAVGSGVAGTTAAPTNGLLVQGNTSLQGNLAVAGTSTFTGNVTFSGGTTGITAATSFPLLAPTGTTASPNYAYAFTGKTTSALSYNTTTSALTIYNAGTAIAAATTTGLGLGLAAPTAQKVQLLAGQSAVAGVSTNTPTIQVAAPTGNGGYFSVTDNDAAVATQIGFNSYTGDGVPVSTLVWSSTAKPILFAVGTSYLNVAASAYNVSGSFFWNFGSKSQSLSTVGVTGNLAIGSTVATGTAAPANGLLVQGNGLFTGYAGFSAGTAPGTINAPITVGANSINEGTSPIQVYVAPAYGQYIAFNNASTGVGGRFGYNSYTADGVSLEGTTINASNGKPVVLNFGYATPNYQAAFRTTGATIGSGASTPNKLGVFGSVAIGSTGATATAPTDGLLVQGNTVLQGSLTPAAVVLPVSAQSNSLSVPASISGAVISLASGTATLPTAAPGLNYTIVGTGNAIAVATSGSDVLYWGGSVTTANGAPTNKASGTTYSHPAGNRGATIQVKCVSAGIWNITQLIGNTWS